jgi:hypothetical protein
MRDQPVAQDNTNTEKVQKYVHALSGIRIHDPSVWAGKDILCPRPHHHCDPLELNLISKCWLTHAYLNNFLDKCDGGHGDLAVMGEVTV